MKSPISVIMILLFSVLLAGCSQSQSSNGTADKKTPPHAKKAPSKKIHKQVKKEKPEIPYAPLLPDKDAKSLQSRVEAAKQPADDQKKKNANAQSRTVPLGQTLRAGKQDLTNGPLKKYRLVSYYGTPLTDAMGILGEYSPEEMMKKLKDQAQVYSNLDPDRPAIPTIELIATMAQRDPGPNGLYVTQLKADKIRQYVDLAKDHKALVLIDIQLGRDAIMNEVKALEPFLKEPNVELAIDTEFHVKAGQVPGVNLGHVDGANVQEAIDYVDQLIEKNHLPDKVVMVHEFQQGIILNKSLIKPTKHVEVVLNADGFGPIAPKKAKYHRLVTEQTHQYGGLKLFYRKDQPLMKPLDVLQLDPAPAVVNYQ
ncbi:hypothetical protein ACFO4N_12015 [Camelliibacillus cellulosilyticus]|uniref:Lipoprotein n=1 Tax=Camelliibacillus cellulosilyticus TaxID=2174486 RepID=A0ABV9GNA6_9BACL